MSGMIMTRYASGIVCLTDGMTCAGDNDPTLTGIMSKPIVITHMPAVITMTGDYVSLHIGLLTHAHTWRDFDELLANFRQAVGEQIEWHLRNSDLTEIGCRYFIGGYSPSRDRWETYQIETYAYFSDPWDGIGELTPAPEVAMAPAPGVDELVRYGIDAKMDGDRLDVHLENLDMDTLIRLMRAQRATEIGFGIRSENNWVPGHMVGFFIESTVLERDLCVRRIEWRWPDEIGKPIDPTQEGEAVT